MNLGDLKRGVTARIEGIAGADRDLEIKLREIGFSEGDVVELVGRGPFGGQPLAVRLNRTIIALRAAEAAAIRIDPPHQAAPDTAVSPVMGEFAND